MQSDPLVAPRTRPSRVFTERLVEAAPSARMIWALSAWIGLVGGLAESLLRLGWRLLEHRVSNPDLWVNWNAPWMAPPALAAWCFGFGVLASLVSCVAPRTSAYLAPRALIALGAWSALNTIPGLHAWAVNLLALGLGVRLGRRARFDSEGFRRWARRGLPYAAALWLVLFLATGLLPATAEFRALAFGPRAPKDAPNVLLIVLDTVRADNLSLHGYERPTTPNLEAWARRGVRFEQARATTPYTLGTHASLFTGRWMSETSARVNAPLDGRWPTLAEHLRDRGYATGGFVGNIFYGSAHYGLDRGFLRYHDVPEDITRRVTPREFFRSCVLGESLITWFERRWRILAPMQRQRLDAGALNREALAWIDRTRSRGRPYFLFLNYFDAHAPYGLPAEAPQPFSTTTPERLEAKSRRLDDLREHAGSAPPAEVARLRAEVLSSLFDVYDDGISWIDRKLDELLRALDRRGLLDNTLVVITADHGEMLGEHDLIGHGDSLHRPVVHVPLVVLGGRDLHVPAGETVSRPVSLRNIPATILDLIGDPEGGRFPGPSLRGLWSRSADDATRESPVLSEMEHMPWLPHKGRIPAASGPLWLLTEGRWSYHRQDHETLVTREELFDLTNDPVEQHDLANDPVHRADLESLRERFARARGSASSPLSPSSGRGPE